MNKYYFSINSSSIIDSPNFEESLEATINDKEKLQILIWNQKDFLLGA